VTEFSLLGYMAEFLLFEWILNHISSQYSILNFLFVDTLYYILIYSITYDNLVMYYNLILVTLIFTAGFRYILRDKWILILEME